MFSQYGIGCIFVFLDKRAFRLKLHVVMAWDFSEEIEVAAAGAVLLTASQLNHFEAAAVRDLISMPKTDAFQHFAKKFRFGDCFLSIALSTRTFNLLFRN